MGFGSAGWVGSLTIALSMVMFWRGLILCRTGARHFRPAPRSSQWLRGGRNRYDREGGLP